ncbi:MAG: hypothetical protein WBW81_16630 [Methylocella sp.]
MFGFWSKKNRELIAWWGGGVAAIIGAIWAVFVYFLPPKSDAEDHNRVTATSGGVVIGGNVVNSTVNAGSQKHQIPPQALRGEEPSAQVSYGNGSPNISNMGGNVDISINK